MEYVVNNKASLERLENDKPLKQTVRRIKIELSSNTDFSRYERQLNRYYFSCGCETGSFVVLATLLAGCVIWLTGVAPAIWVWWRVLTILVVSALFGKISGLCISRMKVKALLRELRVHCRDS